MKKGDVVYFGENTRLANAEGKIVRVKADGKITVELMEDTRVADAGDRFDVRPDQIQPMKKNPLNHLGEREFQTYAAWRRAAKAAGATQWEGDKDIAHAWALAENGQRIAVGAWEGDKGYLYNAMKTNPRIRRSQIGSRGYIARPSQITRKKPTKRLKRRRRANLAAGAEGFFPNPQRGPSQIKRLTDTNAAGPWEFSFKGSEGTKFHFMNRYARFNEAWEVATKFAEISYPGATVRLRDESKREKTIYYRFTHAPMKTNPLGPKLSPHAKSLRTYGRRNLGNALAAQFMVQAKRGTQWRTLATFFAEQSARDYAMALHERYPRATIRVFKGGEPMRRNPIEETPEVLEAAKLFNDFTGHEVKTGREVTVPAAKVGLAVGPLLAVAYETTRDGKREKYLHEFAPGARPILAASSDGRSLFMLGGAYRFTDRGIVDKPRRRR